MRGGANLPLVSSYNRALVLDAIRTQDSISRVEIARLTGLTAQTVGNIVRRLLEDELVVEAGQGASTGGKPRTLLRLNASARYSVGVHVDPHEIVFVVADLAGNLVARARAGHAVGRKARASIRQLGEGVRAVLSEAGVPRDRVLGVGVAVPGPIDPDRGVVIAPPNLREWRDVPLGEALTRETGLPVIVDNDATAAAIGEMWAGDVGDARTFACIYLGTGVGAGLFFHGEAYRGRTSNAGELGHISLDMNGEPCHCGNRGCLELVCAPSAIVRDLETRLAAGGTSSVDLSGVEGVFAKYELVGRGVSQGDPLAAEVVGRAAQALAAATVTLVNLLDVEAVVLCGFIMDRVGSTYADAIRAALGERSMARASQRIEVRVSALGSDAGALGAAVLPLHSMFAPRFTGLAEIAQPTPGMLSG